MTTKMARWICGAAGAALLVPAMMFPLWQATLNAPQYPGGLKMIAYGDRVTGDVREINGLNHYIGMKPLKWSDIPERVLWKPGLIIALIAIVIASIVGHKMIHRAAVIGLWLFPIGVLADIQFRLFQYGHDLKETAALRIPEFTPLVIGPTKVWNFVTWAMPGLGLLALLALAAIVTFGPGLLMRFTLPRVAKPVVTA